MMVSTAGSTERSLFLKTTGDGLELLFKLLSCPVLGQENEQKPLLAKSCYDLQYNTLHIPVRVHYIAGIISLEL